MTQSDLIIIGGGPGGYEIAAEVAAKGMSVTLIERDALGGTCLNRGCIPTKCLCASASTILSVADASRFGVNVAGFTPDYSRAVARMVQVTDQLRDGVTSLLSKVNVVHGQARLASGHVVEVGSDRYTAPRIIIATGSCPAMLDIPGADLAITSDDFLRLTELPRRVAIIGGGVIGMEFASILAAFGTQVSVIEYMKEILPPFDPEVAKRLRMALQKRGVNTRVGAAVTAIEQAGDALRVIYSGKKGEEAVECDTVIMAVGRKAVVPEGCDKAGIALTQRGYIAVDDNYQTSAQEIFAVGDVNGRCMLAHAAAAQARVVMGLMDKSSMLVPSAVFTAPECAMVGLTPLQCDAAGLQYKSAKAMFAANGKALAMGEGEGFVKVIYDARSGRIYGVHIIGPHAADLVAEATAVMGAGMSVNEVANQIVHGHPTLSEVLAAACGAAVLEA